MRQDEVVICGECKHWYEGKCFRKGTIDTEPVDMGIGELACEEFEEYEGNEGQP